MRRRLRRLDRDILHPAPHGAQHNGHDIVDLLNDVSLALAHGGLAWVDKAKARAATPPQRSVAEELAHSHQLISSIDDLE